MIENVGTYLQLLAEEKDISIDLLKEVIESTMILALKKKYGSDTNFHINFDDRNNHTVYRALNVVEIVED